MITNLTWTRLIVCAWAETTLPALLRIRKYLRSAGRYGASSFLVGHYGGTGEIAQGFCRTAAVAGGIYILGRRISAITGPEVQPISEKSPSENRTMHSRYSVELEGVPDKLTSKLIISSLDLVPPHLIPIANAIPSPTSSSIVWPYSSIARCIAIIDRPISFSATSSEPPSKTEGPDDSASSPDETFAPQNVDTAVLVFPPSSLAGGSVTTAVHVLITGEACMTTPNGKCAF